MNKYCGRAKIEGEVRKKRKRKRSGGIEPTLLFCVSFF